jgi:ABC-type dipeptide/oligopeptide/nickel transport system permease subunit
MSQGLAISMMLQPLLEPLNLTVPPGKFIVPTSVLFSRLGPGLLDGTEPKLKGTYTLTFRFLLRLPKRVTFVREGIDTLNVTTVDFGTKMIEDRVFRLGTLAVEITEKENTIQLNATFEGKPIVGKKTFNLGESSITVNVERTSVKVSLGSDTIEFRLNTTYGSIDIYKNGKYLKTINKREYDLTLAGFEGIYKIPIKTDFVEIKKVRVLGAYGPLGTDSFRRDLWSGVLYGVRWALIIGLIVASISTTIGVIYGVIMGYYSGVLSRAMMTIAQIVYSLPVLPLLIMLAYFMGRSIWNVVFLLIAFGWVGGVFTVRAMVLQIKEQLYITAARAVGASNRRIIFKHVFPQVLPYMFASMALGVPGAILSEAGLSFLGLGDPSIVTWGQILNEAQKANAVATGAWWWVLPPGLGIAIVGLTFVLIGHALDKILNPKLVR